MPTRQIVLGLDGSSGAQAAARWCAEYAGPLEADVLGVYGGGFSGLVLGSVPRKLTRHRARPVIVVPAE